jgi:hypothetical protein
MMELNVSTATASKSPRPKVWDRNGWVSIKVLQRHIDHSLERSSSHCMTAAAIAEAVPDATRICVDLQTVRWTRRGLRYCFLTPHVCQDNIIAFDQGERDAIKPFELRMRPAWIARAGRKRRETPSNSELRGTGLTVAKVQPHLNEPEPQPQPVTKERRDPHLLADGTRNTSPDREDGLYNPAARRVARAKVSTAPKGSVPTTLGGRMPPTSILSRREYGLRQLRR